MSIKERDAELLVYESEAADDVDALTAQYEDIMPKNATAGATFALALQMALMRRYLVNKERAGLKEAR